MGWEVIEDPAVVFFVIVAIICAFLMLIYTMGIFYPDLKWW